MSASDPILPGGEAGLREAENRAREYHREVDDGSVWAFMTEEVRDCYRQSAERLHAKWTAKTAGGAGEWQPIETAPKDGTLFLAYAEAGQHGLPAMYSLCAWHPDAGFCIDELREPTHWKSLDPSPQGEGGGA